MDAIVTTLVSAQNTLGESPFWHAGRQSIFWVDIAAGLLREVVLSTRKVSRWGLGRRVSLIVGGNENELILGTQGGIMRFSLSTGLAAMLLPLEAELADRRCNDGHCDAMGRLWVGVMDTQCAVGEGSLYRVGHPLKAEKMLSGLTIPNGLVWSADHTKMYFIDTPSRMVKCFDYDMGTGAIENGRAAVVIPEEMGMPDGMSIDEEGMLWVALFGGAAVSRWNPETGQLLKKISIPALQVTNCCFAGKNLDQLIVTTATEHLSPDQLQQYPQSGHVFRVENPGVKGIKPFDFKFSPV